MSNDLSPEVIQKIAGLARLNVEPAESQLYSQQLTQVLSFFQQIAAINTEGVEPLITPTEVEMIWREDASVKPLAVQEILANAPDKTGNLFTVPPVV